MGYNVIRRKDQLPKTTIDGITSDSDSELDSSDADALGGVKLINSKIRWRKAKQARKGRKTQRGKQRKKVEGGGGELKDGDREKGERVENGDENRMGKEIGGHRAVMDALKAEEWPKLRTRPKSSDRGST
jgi:hypothetical protein